ncbi:MAG: HAMP domain-containing sensor histidine kinase [Bacilli bacterium]
MKYIGSKLSRQLLSIIIIIFGLVFISLGILLPRALLPVYENNLYNYLRQPLFLVEGDIRDNIIDTEVGYIYLYNGDSVVSDNLIDIINIKNIGELLGKMTNQYGKFKHNNNDYYYYKLSTGSVTKIALTNDKYINYNKQEVLYTLLPIVLITFVIVALILIIWSGIIVRKIERLKTKIDHIDDDDYDHSIDNIKIDDEIKSLAYAVEDMRVSLKNQEEYRNQMYQNISHDFKTPLTVIKSYVEAVHDGIEDKDQALTIIEEQADKLEQKVHSLLYLNKLDYIKDFKNITLKKIDIRPLIEASINKFKFRRKDVKFIVQADKNALFYGTDDLWETIIDNMLNNFMRYAETEIKITTKQNKITFYNDGENINEDLKEVIFVPFRKGMKGEFGLGLSIIKKSVNLIGYDISIKNHKKGISFTISKGVRK